MNIALIMRGVPGSGKSTLAKQLAGTSGIIHSTDDFFVGVDGVYRWDAGKLQENHDRNFSAFCESLARKVPVVICDNTNVRRRYYERYVAAAQNAGYRTAIVTLPHPDAHVAAKRTVHGVPVHVIRRLIDTWES